MKISFGWREVKIMAKTFEEKIEVYIVPAGDVTEAGVRLMARNLQAGGGRVIAIEYTYIPTQYFKVGQWQKMCERVPGYRITIERTETLVTTPLPKIQSLI